MSRHFVDIAGVASGDAGLQHCLDADDCLRISYAASDTAAASVSRVAADGRTVAMASIGAIQDMLRGLAPATPVMTATGVRPAAALVAGDRVVAADGRTAVVVAVSRRQLGWRELGVNPFLRPIRIAEGALGEGFPREALVVAPGQPVPDCAGGAAAIVAAHTLLGRPGVTRLASRSATYVAVALSDGHAAPLPAACATGAGAPGLSA